MKYCKGSMMLGTGCGICPRCVDQIHLGNYKKPISIPIASTNSAIDYEAKMKLETAAQFKAIDVAPSLFQLMGYRQGIAHGIISDMYDGVAHERAMELIEIVNRDIKKLLAL